MYEELVKALRCCSDDNIPCKSCPRYAKCTSDRNMNSLFPEAADAIEELDRRAITIQQEMMAEAESHIALTERLNTQIEELSRQLTEYKKYDSFLMAHGMFGEPPKEDNDA